MSIDWNELRESYLAASTQTHATPYEKRVLGDMARRIEWAKQKSGRRFLTAKQRAFADKLIAAANERKTARDNHEGPKDEHGNVLVDPEAEAWTPQGDLATAQDMYHDQRRAKPAERDKHVMRQCEEFVRSLLQDDALPAYIEWLRTEYDLATTEELDALLGTQLVKALAKGRITNRGTAEALLRAMPGVWTVVRVGKASYNDFGMSYPYTLENQHGARIQWWTGCYNNRPPEVGHKCRISSATVKKWGGDRWVSTRGFSYLRPTSIKTRRESVSWLD